MNRALRGAASLLLTIAATLSVAPSARAQDDFRHLDEGRPTRVEDAYPLKYMEWEWQVGGAFGAEEGGGYEAGGIFELKTGIWRNFQLGAEAHSTVERESGVSTGGLEELAFHLLYNLNQEGRSMPALGVRVDLITPGTGALSRDRAGARFRVMGTRTVGGMRLHVNSARTWASASDGRDHWSGGLGFDRVLGLSGRALVGDLYGEFPDGGHSRLWIDVGLRVQVSKTSVLDLGVTSRLDQLVEGGGNVGLIVGVSHAFGFRGLVDVPPYPDPLIR